MRGSDPMPRATSLRGGKCSAPSSGNCTGGSTRDANLESLDAARPGELPGLEALLAEYRTPLRRPERHRRFLAARRAGRRRFDALACSAGPGRPARAFGFAGLAPFRLVLEVLVGEKLLLAACPDELRAANHAVQHPVLELHCSIPRGGGAGRLLQLAPELFPVAFPGQSLLGPPFVAWL